MSYRRRKVKPVGAVTWAPASRAEMVRRRTKRAVNAVLVGVSYVGGLVMVAYARVHLVVAGLLISLWFGV